MYLDFFRRDQGFVIGMVHLLPLIGTHGYKGDNEKIINQAIYDAKTLEKAGVDAVIVENMGDTPFGITLDTAQRVQLAAVSALVKRSINIPVGIDAAMNDYEASISIAKACDADFVRIPVFVDLVSFYGGIIKPVAREAVQYRKEIGAENVKILADVMVKHTDMVLPNVKIEESAMNAESCGADAIIVTGTKIGEETPLDLIRRVKAVTKVPIIAGSGVNESNVEEQFKIADGAIVGSGLKKDGFIENPISFELTESFMKKARRGKEK